jgi:drug/metabolite transporter (DMT)-like permease
MATELNPSPSERARRGKALQMLILATAFWGISFPIIKMIAMLQQELLPGASTWLTTAVATAVRFGGAAILMLFSCWRTLPQITRLELSQGLGLGISGGIGIMFQMDGLIYTEASTSAFLTQAYCLIIPFVAGFMERKWPAPAVLLSCVLMFTGVGVLTQLDLKTFRLGRGETETLIAAVIFTFQILWLERPVFRRNNVKHFSTIMFATMAILSVPVMMATAHRVSDVVRVVASMQILILVLILIVVCTLFAYLMMNYWQPFVSATQAGLIYGIEPICASLFSLFLPQLLSNWTGLNYPNENLTINLVLGGGLIVLANILIQIKGHH